MTWKKITNINHFLYPTSGKLSI